MLGGNGGGQARGSGPHDQHVTDSHILTIVMAWDLGLGAWERRRKMRGMRAVLIAAVTLSCLVTVAVARAGPSSPVPSPKSQQPQQPVFRAGIELVTVDVTALDSNGRQVTDLTAADFQVDIDGDRRQVTSAEYVRSADPLRAIGTPHKVVVPDETFSSSNAKGAAERPPDRDPRRPGQHPHRLGARGDEQREEVRRHADCRGSRGGDRRAGPRRARRLHHQSRSGPRVAAADRRPGRGAENALQPVGHRGDGDLHAGRHAARPRGDPARVRPAESPRRKPSGASAKSNRTPPSS